MTPSPALAQVIAKMRQALDDYDGNTAFGQATLVSLIPDWADRLEALADPALGAQEEKLTDDRIREIWRSVQGPKAELAGPLIRFAHKVAAIGA